MNPPIQLDFFYRDIYTNSIVFQCRAVKGTLLTAIDEKYKASTGNDPCKPNIACWWEAVKEKV